ncbi:9392_t:CDS:2, partial [Dentiscutata heterogama]
MAWENRAVIRVKLGSNIFDHDPVNGYIVNIKRKFYNTRVLDIKHYQDGTAVLRISRDNYYIGSTARCLEQKLMLRIIQTNGSVIPLELDYIDEIQDINYCYVNAKSPISIYPLFDQYILVTYIHATNTSDNATFMDRGIVVDWFGKNFCQLDFGPSYLFPDTNIWSPNDYITVNIEPRKGFLRLSTVRGTNNFEWVQYNYTGGGYFSLSQSNTVENLNFANLQVSVLPTLSYGYVIIYTNTTHRTLLENGGLYAIFLNYSQKRTSQPFVLHEKSTQNIIFTKLTCSIDYINVSYVCVLTIEQKDLVPVNGTNNTSTITNTSYIKMSFFSTGPWLKSDLIFNLTLTSFRTLPVGGYVLISRNTVFSSAVNFTIHLYDEYDKPSTWEFLQQPIISNLVSSYDILPNNTMLVAQNETTTDWKLLNINLPHLGPFNDSGYGNLHVNLTHPSINSSDLALNSDVIYIIYQEPVSLSDGNLTIIRLTEIITFNYPGGRYCIQIDNNFVKNANFGEPMLGIQQNIWTFETANNESSEQNQESNDIIPTEVGRLGPIERNQFDPTDLTKILISFSIIGTNRSAKMTANEIAKDLDQLIKNKAYTAISIGLTTKYLDETYGLGLH